MPWNIVKRDGQYCVVKEGSSEAVPGGCHSRKEEAAAHMGALYANVPEAKAACDRMDWAKLDAEPCCQECAGKTEGEMESEEEIDSEDEGIEVEDWLTALLLMMGGMEKAASGGPEYIRRRQDGG